MNKVKQDDIRPEYDFRGGQRGRYARRYVEGTNLILLSPDLAAVFPDSDSVNKALRDLVRIAERNAQTSGRKSPARNKASR